MAGDKIVFVAPFHKGFYYFILLLLLWMGGCNQHPYPQGETLYRFHCESCHMQDGSGLAHLIPALDESKLLLSDPEKLVCLIRKGLPVNVKTGQKMPPNTGLNDVEMTNLVNFLGYKYGAFDQTVQAMEVKMWMGNCQLD